MSNFPVHRQTPEFFCYHGRETILGSAPITLTLLILGLLLLLAGGFGLVRGASGLAEGYGVPPLVVGMTVVAFGTSAPELVVNIVGALNGETALAFGNITGSNLANIGLVLGSAALVTPIALEGKIIRRELPLLLLATMVLFAMTLDHLLRSSIPVLDRSDAVILLMLFGVFIYITVQDLLRQQQDPLLTTIDKLHLVPHVERRINWIMVAAGVIGLAVGAQLTIDSGADLATEMGAPPVVVGLLVVAIGTSLPELVTSVLAAFKRDPDLCVGNVIGSNIFNAMFVLPVSALIRPLEVPAGGSIDIFAGLVFSLALIPVFIAGRTIMSRQIGAAFLVVYVVYMLARYNLS